MRSHRGDKRASLPGWLFIRWAVEAVSFVEGPCESTGAPGSQRHHTPMQVEGWTRSPSCTTPSLCFAAPPCRPNSRRSSASWPGHPHGAGWRPPCPAKGLPCNLLQLHATTTGSCSSEHQLSSWFVEPPKLWLLLVLRGRLTIRSPRPAAAPKALLHPSRRTLKP